ncbi:hypothetical protein [Streptosporangium sp. NPDC001681]|uniref:hypothetical protein n=1 Tax=Streptosporangium sp. NPDC001681 TaxID=3154395 RepID=UPI003318829A
MMFRDETAAGRALEKFSLPDLPERISAREPVRLRVREEVARHNASPSHHFRGPVKPADAEAEPNGYRMRTARRLDREKQADATFTRNGFVDQEPADSRRR